MRISHHPYHSFYHRETKAQQRVYIHLVKWTLNSKTEMRHSVLLFVISLFSPFFSLGIFCQFIVLCRLCMLWNWPHVFKQKARKKEHLMTGSIHFSWQKHLFTSVPCTHATVIIASLPLFFVKGQTIHSQLFFLDRANRKIRKSRITLSNIKNPDQT